MITTKELALSSQEVYNENVPTHVAGNSQALLRMDNAKNASCTFRGTEKHFGDILTDMRFAPWYSHKIKAWCHAGFLKETRKMYEIMFRDVISVLRICSDITFTGHSLGGAQATIFTCMIAKDAPWAVRKNQLRLTCFGSPPPQYGNGLEKWLQKIPVMLYKNGSDCIPSHPFLGRHVTRITHIGEEDTAIRSVSIHRYTDHKIERYISSL